MPLSASVLTRDEIQKAGVTSLPEALRLIPGLIVRQQTNGNYDIHIRGLDNVPPNTSQSNSSNITTLVMIDDRPVYNYLQGGAFWESLPIDLIDVEKIEVVRGPSATLYGPNAVSGVINIITKKTDKDGLHTHASVQYGSLNTTIGNASLGYQFNKKLSAIVSGNYRRRGREVSYYHPFSGRFFNHPDSLTYLDEQNKAPQRYPHPDRSMDKYGANLFLQINPHDKVNFSLAGGLQDSKVQIGFGSYFVSSLATATSKTAYADLKANVYGFNSHLSFLNGKQDASTGLTGSAYDFSALDALLEYDIKVNNNLSIKPAANYRSAVYDDTPYLDPSSTQGVLRSKAQLDTYAGSIRVDYKTLSEKLRLIGGTRLDKFTHPAKRFLSYQFVASFKPSANQLIRAGYSKAFRSAVIESTYMNLTQQYPLMDPGMPAGSYVEVALRGNKNLTMLNSTMLEFGYRRKLADNFWIDMEAYHTTTKDYSAVIMGATIIQPGANPEDPIRVGTSATFENLPISVRQSGVSLSANFVRKSLQLKPFITLQATSLFDYSKYSNSADAQPEPANEFNPALNNFNSGIGSTIKHKSTPRLYGGAYINYQVSQKFNLNLTPYYYSSQTFYHSDNLTYNDDNRGVQHIDAKLLLNATITYMPIKPLSMFVSAKNLLNDNSREYYKTDEIGAMFFAGATLKY